MEFEEKKKIEEEKHRRLAEEEKTRLKELHSMKCAKCRMGLVEIDYKGSRSKNIPSAPGSGSTPKRWRRWHGWTRSAWISSSACSENDPQIASHLSAAARKYSGCTKSDEECRRKNRIVDVVAASE